MDDSRLVSLLLGLLFGPAGPELRRARVLARARRQAPLATVNA